MISLSNLAVHFGGNYLFDGVSLTISKGDKIGLIGRNGSGKTTLLRIIARWDTPETGTVAIPNDFKIGYLPQEVKIETDKNIFDEASTALEEIKGAERDVAVLSDEIAERTDYESKSYELLLHKLDRSNERLRLLGGASAEAVVERILVGLGFSRKDFGKKVAEFSGGRQMRIELAKILLQAPDCVLLDEPTNHLDIESLAWVEAYFKKFPGSIVLVSHDKKFLDSVTNRTAELVGGKMYDYKAPYSEFVAWREERMETLEKAFKNQRRKIAQTERFIERFRYKSTLATRVQSRIKQLEKTERIELDEVAREEVKIKFPTAPRCGIIAAEARNLTKSYGDNLVLDRVNFTIERGERIAFVGKNGEGKSTLSRILAGKESAEGSVKIGLNVHIGYFAQKQAETLDESASVFDVIDRAATGDMRMQIRNLLGAFLFSGDDVYKKVKVLSGGEKARLAIAKMLLEPMNLMILDEPTNHLDMISKDVLKDALKTYDGALIIVSHDRDFLDGLTDKTVEFRDKKLIEIPGGIYDYLEKRRFDEIEEVAAEVKAVKSKKKSEPGAAKIAFEEAKKTRREKSKIEKAVAESETKIEKIETEIAEIEDLFASPEFYEDQEKSVETKNRFEALQNELEAEMEEWERLHQELESFE